MTSLVKKAAIGLAMGAAALTTMAPSADAQRYGRYRHHDHTGTAVVAGIAGLAIGAAIASSGDRRYDYDRRYYRDHGYYPQDGYYYRDYNRRGWANCYDRRVWDPYLERRVIVRTCD